MGDVGREEVDGGAVPVQDASVPAKALVYTDAFQSEQATDDLDDDALSSATGTTVKGRGSPCSIADLSSLEPSQLVGASSRAREPAKGLRMGEHGKRIFKHFTRCL